MVVLTGSPLKLPTISSGVGRTRSAASIGQPRQHRPSVGDEVRERLLAAYVAGSSTLELAEEFRLHRGTVHSILQKAGVLRSRKALTKDQVEVAVTLRAQGLFYRQIAERFAVDTETVRRAISRQLATGS